MAIIVQKYGGSSLANIEQLKAVAGKLVERKRTGVGLVVVVSAMGDTTDELLALAGQITDTPKRRELDMLLTVGERTTMALLSMAIDGLGEEAISLTGSQCGILTTDSHSRARIMEVRPFRVQDELAKGRIVIVAGYQGTSYKREITTLGRGGSDLTAVALAAALDAEACEIYSDVEGVFTADPRVVPSATRIENMSYDEMIAMAIGGARVLNRDAVEWAKRTSVALYARSTFGTDSGTVVRKHLPSETGPVTAVTGRTDVVMVEHPEHNDLLSALDSVPILAWHVTDSVSRAYIPREDVPEMADLIAELKAAGCRVDETLGSVTVVGAKLGQDPTIRKSINTQFSGYNNHFSAICWTAFLPAEKVNSTVILLHEMLL